MGLARGTERLCRVGLYRTRREASLQPPAGAVGAAQVLEVAAAGPACALVPGEVCRSAGGIPGLGPSACAGSRRLSAGPAWLRGSAGGFAGAWRSWCLPGCAPFRDPGSPVSPGPAVGRAPLARARWGPGAPGADVGLGTASRGCLGLIDAQPNFYQRCR